MFHRTPLTAHALPDLQAARRRPIARVVFHGADVDGQPVLFSEPKQTSELEVCAITSKLPAGLRAAVEAFTLKGSKGSPIDHALSEESRKTQAFENYVAGDSSLVAFFRQRGVENDM